MPKPKSPADVPLANRLHKLLLVYSAVGTLCIGLIVSLVAVPPLYKRLAQAQENHLLFAVKTRSQVIDQWLFRAKDVAAQITSPTKAREKLEAYNRGEATLAEIDAFSRPILGDALKKTNEIARPSRSASPSPSPPG